MQVDETKTKPKSLWRHLYQQVEEQSHFCDVTVQVKSWRRKFHWCVLMASPVFAKLHESKLKERQTGLININIGTANSVQIAIHFLYGKLPTITLNNVEDLLEVAEFLMIEELKAVGISKLKEVKINEDNCLKVLMLASRYDFYLENVSDFIYANLSDLLRKDEMLLLDKESVRFILTDQLLAYVSRDDCFRFLIKWVGHCETRKSDFVKLFTCLDKDDLSAEVLSTVDLDCLSETDKPLCNNLSGDSNRWCDMLAVYPSFYISGEYHLYVYNSKKKMWFTIPIKDRDYCSGDVRASMLRENTVVNYKSVSQSIGFYNLATEKELHKRIEVMDSHESLSFNHFNISNEKMFCVGAYTYLPKAGSSRRWVPRRNASCLLVSVNEDKSTVTMRNLISVRGAVQSACVTDGAICLLIPESKHIIVYSDRQSLVTKFDLLHYQLDQKSYICPRVRGGIYVVTKLHVLQLNVQVNCSDITVCGSDILAQVDDGSSNPLVPVYPPIYEILPDKILTITRGGNRGECQFWYQSLPEKIGLLHHEEKFKIDVPEQLKYNSNIHFLQMTLPKEKMTCPIDCPHCKYKTTTAARYNRDYYEPDYDSDCIYYDSDDYNPYDNDSDSDYNGYDYYPYYFDSD